MDMDTERRLLALEEFMRSFHPEMPGNVSDWTPQLYQNGDITSTVEFARYSIVGGLCLVQMRLVATAAGTAGTAIQIQDLPVAAIYSGVSGDIAGVAMVRDTGTAFYASAVELAAATTVQFIGYGTTNLIGVSPSFALAAGDIVGMNLVYEI